MTSSAQTERMQSPISAASVLGDDDDGERGSIGMQACEKQSQVQERRHKRCRRCEYAVNTATHHAIEHDGLRDDQHHFGQPKQ